MLIKEAELILHSYGVSKVERYHSADCQAWKIWQNDVAYIYTGKLETIVEAIMAAADW